MKASWADWEMTGWLTGAEPPRPGGRVRVFLHSDCQYPKVVLWLWSCDLLGLDWPFASLFRILAFPMEDRLGLMGAREKEKGRLCVYIRRQHEPAVSNWSNYFKHLLSCHFFIRSLRSFPIGIILLCIYAINLLPSYLQWLLTFGKVQSGKAASSTLTSKSFWLLGWALNSPTWILSRHSILQTQRRYFMIWPSLVGLPFNVRFQKIPLTEEYQSRNAASPFFATSILTMTPTKKSLIV